MLFSGTFHVIRAVEWTVFKWPDWGCGDEYRIAGEDVACDHIVEGLAVEGG